MDTMMIKVFARTDELGGIWALASVEEAPEAGWIQIDAGAADDPKYGQAHLYYAEDTLIHPTRMVPRYSVVEGRLRTRTEAEMDEAMTSLPEPEPTLAAKLVRMMEADGALSDRQALTLQEAFRTWKPGATYGQGEKVRHEEALYSVQQSHTAQVHQPPGSEGMLAIYRSVQSEPAEGEVLPWMNGEAVRQGDRRAYNGMVFECIGADGAGANVWTPDTVPAVWKRVG